MDSWNPFEESPVQSSGLDRIVVGDTEIKAGDRVRLRPMGRADIFDIALDGKIATVVSIERDFENRTYLAVTVEDDPGNDLGLTGKPGHRFFFGVDEVQPLAGEPIG
jgi:hypothetical protein